MKQGGGGAGWHISSSIFHFPINMLNQIWITELTLQVFTLPLIGNQIIKRIIFEEITSNQIKDFKKLYMKYMIDISYGLLVYLSPQKKIGFYVNSQKKYVLRFVNVCTLS